MYSVEVHLPRGGGWCERGKITASYAEAYQTFLETCKQFAGRNVRVIQTYHKQVVQGQIKRTEVYVDTQSRKLSH